MAISIVRRNDEYNDPSGRTVPPDDGIAIVSSPHETTASDSTGVLGRFEYDQPMVRISLAALLVLLSFFLLILVFLIFRAWTRQRQQELARRAAAVQEQFVRKQPMDQNLLRRRYETIETWLISKRVQKHDELCSRILQKYHNFDCSSSCGCSSNHSTGSTDIECPICMGSFLPGEIVSWSPGSCRHIFHHECIKQWLLQNVGCPFCRETFLPVDDWVMGCNNRNNADTKIQVLRDLSALHFRRSALTYVCAKDGLVEIPPNGPCCTAKQLREIECKIGSGDVTREDKVKLRGNRSNTVIIDDENNSHSIVIEEIDNGTSSQQQQQQQQPESQPLTNSVEVVYASGLHETAEEGDELKDNDEQQQQVRESV